MARRLDTAHGRHVDVDDNDVGREIANAPLTASAPVAASPTITSALLLEQVPQAGAKEIVVVDEQHTKRLRMPFFGSLHQLGHRESPLSAAPSVLSKS